MTGGRGQEPVLRGLMASAPAVTREEPQRMPTYEYRCQQCGVFEVEQRITEDPLKECPTCQQPVQRLISRNVNILFKGSGFHITDYRSSGYKAAAKQDSSGSSGGESASSSGAKAETA